MKVTKPDEVLVYRKGQKYLVFANDETLGNVLLNKETDDHSAVDMAINGVRHENEGSASFYKTVTLRKPGQRRGKEIHVATWCGYDVRLIAANYGYLEGRGDLAQPNLFKWVWVRRGRSLWLVTSNDEMLKQNEPLPESELKHDYEVCDANGARYIFLGKHEGKYLLGKNGLVNLYKPRKFYSTKKVYLHGTQSPCFNLTQQLGLEKKLTEVELGFGNFFTDGTRFWDGSHREIQSLGFDTYGPVRIYENGEFRRVQDVTATKAFAFRWFMNGKQMDATKYGYLTWKEFDDACS